MTQAWQDLFARSLTRPTAVAARFSLDLPALARVADEFPARINPYFASLIREEGDPLWLQVVPSPAEIAREGTSTRRQSPARATGGSDCPLDPLREERHSPVPNLVHRYPDRALFLV
jgi:lysine 2,3-aminomutase